MNTGRSSDFGGDVGRAWRISRHQLRRSCHRREARMRRAAIRRQRLRVLAIPALAGVAVLLSQVTAATPWPLAVIVGVALVVPWLTVWLD